MENNRKLKNLYDYKKEIEDALNKGLIKGTIEGNCFELNNAFIDNLIIIYGFVFSFFLIFISLILKFQFLLTFGFIGAICFPLINSFSNKYLVLDFNNKSLYSVQRFFGILQIYKTKPIYFKDIKCIGTQHIGCSKRYAQAQNDVVLIGKKPSEKEIEENLVNYLSTNIVALVDSKIINLTIPFEGENASKEYDSAVCVIANLINVPCKVCERNQKLIIGNDSTGKQTLIISPYFDEKEKAKNESNQKKLTIFVAVLFGGIFLIFILASILGQK